MNHKQVSDPEHLTPFEVKQLQILADDGNPIDPEGRCVDEEASLNGQPGQTTSDNRMNTPTVQDEVSLLTV